MKNVILFVFGLVIFNVTVQAQHEYKSAVGARIGAYTYINASYKTFISDQGALEFIAGFGGYGRGLGVAYYTRIGAAALYQHHLVLPGLDIDGLRFYFGGGPLVGLNFYQFIEDTFEFGVVFGAGLDYKFADLPLNVSLDFFPGIRFTPDFGLTSLGGLSVRYTLN